MPPGMTRSPLASMTSGASAGSASGEVSETMVPSRTPTSQVPVASGPTTSPPRTSRSSMPEVDFTRGRWPVEGRCGAPDLYLGGLRPSLFYEGGATNLWGGLGGMKTMVWKEQPPLIGRDRELS